MTTALSDLSCPQPAHANIVHQTRLTLDAMTDHAAVLDARGVVVMVNRAWQQYGLTHTPNPGQMLPTVAIGCNYLDVSGCDGEARDNASKAASGIRTVLAGLVDAFTLRYTCHTAQQQHWFTLQVSPLPWARQRGALITHTNTTPQHRLQFR